MGPISIRFNVTNGLPAGVTDGRNITIATWLFWPDDLTLLGKRPVKMTLLNGGSCDKRYFHVQLPGRSGYSAAEHLAARGNIVLLTDRLGVGESSRLASQKKGTRQIAALANKLAVSQFYDRLTAGELHPLLPSIGDFAKFGGGHSMGGMQTIVQQAEYPIYDAVMILGYTAEGVHLTMGGKRLRAADLIPPGESPDYSANDRAVNTRGLPGYTFERAAGELWRCRFDAERNIIVVNSGHRDFVFATRNRALQLRYLVRLYVKELVLKNFAGLPADQLLERMIELSLYAEEKLKSAQA
jgi:hypothetical protein